MIKIKNYEINWSEKRTRWICTCPDFKFHRSRTKNEICKHIKQALDEKIVTPKKDDFRYKTRIFFEKTVSMINEMLKDYKYEICGSYRRRAPFLKDLDVLVLIQNEDQRKELMERIELVGSVETGANKRLTCLFDGVQVDFRIVEEIDVWGAMLCHFTGSKVENIRLRQKAKALGMKLSEYGLIRGEQVIASKTEKEIYKALGEPFKTPWLRS